MSAVIYDVVADQGRDFNLSVVWYDVYDVPHDLTGYGAVAVVIDRKTRAEISRITHDDYILIYTPEEEGHPNQGRIHFVFPANDMENAPKECEYELVVFPNEDHPETAPSGLLRGLMSVRPKTIETLVESS